MRFTQVLILGTSLLASPIFAEPAAPPAPAEPPKAAVPAPAPVPPAAPAPQAELPKASAMLATPEEVISRVRQAVAFLREKGKSGFPEFNNRNGGWVWKDSYIFLYNCQRDEMVAHPMRPDLVGRSILQIQDEKGKFLFQELCKAGKKPNGGWVEYYWTKIGEGRTSRKISYALAADISFDTGTQVGAGIYDDKITAQQLDELLTKMSDPSKYPMLQ